MSNYLGLETNDGIATLTIDRPALRNAMNYEMWRAFPELCSQIRSDPKIRALVITGAGEKAFSAGADIKDFEQYRKDPAGAKDWAQLVENALQSLLNLPIPTISKIKGYCIGGGCELACFTDIRVAADEARFAFPAARLGLVLGHLEVRRLIDLVGVGNATFLLLSTREIRAEEALRMGLITRMESLANLDEYVASLATELASLAPLSLRYTKEIIRTTVAKPDVEHLSVEESNSIFEIFQSRDYKEGRTAFVEKRKPRFIGR